MGSNLQFRARRSHPSSFRLRVNPIELSGGGPRSAAHRPNQVASPRARCRHGERIASAGSTFRICLPLAERGRVPQNAMRPQPNAWLRSTIRSSGSSIPPEMRSFLGIPMWFRTIPPPRRSSPICWRSRRVGRAGTHPRIEQLDYHSSLQWNCAAHSRSVH